MMKVLFAIAARINGFDAVTSKSVFRAIQTRLSVSALVVDDKKSPSLDIFDNQRGQPYCVRKCLQRRNKHLPEWFQCRLRPRTGSAPIG